jgi:hypothetical protein
MAFKESKRHQLLQAIRTLSSIVQFVDRDFDFSSKDGKEMLKEAREACLLLEKEIEIAHPKKS